ncbi:MAG: hypoxanthine phosphoribosyltransferase [Dehalococcoidales bacterium]|nr:hypoxanthine phosphoribosyltransferase [Dehalococcoidales bacterium]
MDNRKLKVLLSHDEISAVTGKLTADITRDYHDKNPLLIGVLKGAFIFMADLVRRLDFPLELEFVRLASYSGTETTGRLKMPQALTTPIKGKDVLVIEDIVDTGLTTAFIMRYLRRKSPASLKLCALLNKPARRRVPLDIDYLGCNVPDQFLVGYGLDCDQQYRNLPDICILEEKP